MAVSKEGSVAPIQLPSQGEPAMLDVPAAHGNIDGRPHTATGISEFTSSDNEDGSSRPVAAADEDEANDVLGVSISRAQTRMKARNTPVEEKTRAMGRGTGYFESVPDEDAEAEYFQEITTEPDSLGSTPPTEEGPEKKQEGRTASPRDTKDGQPRSSFTRSILKGGLPVRPRAWSGDAISYLKLKKLLPDLGSLAKKSSLSSFIPGPGHSHTRSQSSKLSNPEATAERVRHVPVDQRQVDRPRPYSSAEYRSYPGEEPVSELQPLDRSTTAKHSYQRRSSLAVTGPPLSLRRSTSDQSLYLRNLSRTSSLEQLPRYEHVHSQVNSRIKAIKDSLQDSSSRLLSMPTFNFQDIRSDWGYGRFVGDSNQRRDGRVRGQSDHIFDGAQEKRGAQTRTRSPKSRGGTLYPILTEAMSGMTGDVVVLGGYRGSILRSAKPPHRQLWVPMKVGLNLRKVDLEVGLNREDEEKMEETIFPSGVLSHIGPVDICRRLINKLQKCENARNGELRVWDYGYDWRLSLHLLARRLIEFLEKLQCNAPDVPPEKRGAFVIAHSLGGLITRHAANQRPELFAGVVYAGVPQHCVNILGPLRNGDDVLLSSRVLTAQVNFTFRTSFALLPEDGRCFIDKRTKEEYLVDFFSVQAWEYYRLSPCIAPPLPPLTSDGRRSLMDTIPSTLPSLPKLGKRFSTVLGGKESPMEDPSAPKTVREEEAEQNVPHNAEQSRGPSDAISAATNKATATAPSMQGLVGPTSTPRTSASIASGMTCTIPKPEAMAYLRRTLDEVLRFKQELAFNPSHQAENRYPPFAVLFGKSVPTVYGAKVSSREAIKHQDAYDDLAYAAGDGVCLASAAMLPPGYRIIRGGLVKTDRGHVGLLGDLEAVGQSLLAVVRGRREGVGLGGAPENARVGAIES